MDADNVGLGPYASAPLSSAAATGSLSSCCTVRGALPRIDPVSCRSALGGVLSPASTLTSPDSPRDVHRVHPSSSSPRELGSPGHPHHSVPGLGDTRRRARRWKCSSWGNAPLPTTDREIRHKCEEGAFVSRAAISWLRKVSYWSRWSQRRRRGPLSARSAATQDDSFKGLPNLSQPNTARDLRPFAQGVEIHDGSQHSLDI
eukprot:ctg_1042.g391